MAIVKKALYIIFFLSTALIFAQNNDVNPRLQPVSIATRLSGLTEPLALSDLIEASLRFSGVAESDLVTYTAQLLKIIDEVHTHFKNQEVSADWGDSLLQYIHSKYLNIYIEKQTSLSVLLDKGTYNCVSSAVFYLILCRSVGIEVKGVQTKDHAFCLVHIAGKSFDVETTSQYGFNPGEKKEFTDEFGKITGYSYTPPGNYSQRQIIGEKQILSLILHNRSILWSGSQQYNKAVGLAVDAYELLQDEDSLRFLVDTIYNYGIWASGRKNYESASGIVEQALLLFGENEKLEKLAENIVIQWAVFYVDKNEYDESLALITSRFSQGKVSEEDYRDVAVYAYQKKAEQAAKQYDNGRALEIINEGLEVLGPDKRLLEAKTTFTYMHIKDLIEKSFFEIAFSWLEQSIQTDTLKNEDVTSLFIYLFQKKAEKNAEESGNIKALAILQEGIAYLGKNDKLLALQEMYAYNHILDLINNQFFDEASALLNNPGFSSYLSKKSFNELQVYYYLKRSEVYEKTEGLLKAAQFIVEGIRALGQESRLVRSYEIYIHNHIVALINKKAYQEAKIILEQALEVVPDSTLLKKDLNTVIKIINQ